MTRDGTYVNMPLHRYLMACVALRGYTRLKLRIVLADWPVLSRNAAGRRMLAEQLDQLYLLAAHHPDDLVAWHRQHGGSADLFL
jgi:hypothetical protein